jgi:uncharacterized protein YacL
MWFFRLFYFVFVVSVFYYLSSNYQFTWQQSITYSVIIIIIAYIIEVLFKLLKKEKVASAIIMGAFSLIASNIIIHSFEPIRNQPILVLAFNLLFLYMGLLYGYKNFAWLKHFFTSKKTIEGFFIPIKLLDSSSIIDGRILDIVNTGFLEGKIVIPSFIIKELQTISDSHDHLKRQKGRRGLDIVKNLQSQDNIPVEIYDIDIKTVKTVDEKLVELAKRLDAAIITTDFNLIKVAEIHKVVVLNINALATAVKQTVLPGEELTITVIREGKERDQGLGYLDDGSMVVIENGKKFIGETIKIEVSSLLQSDAGRIIFGKPKK